MKKQFTEDGKCLACELMAKGVNPERLRHKVYHVCILRQYAITAKQEVLENKRDPLERIISGHWLWVKLTRNIKNHL